MAEKTRHDLLARLALVPRTLEARGLDASPPIRAKLLEAGDTHGAGILDVILRDEIGHVAIGNHWYRHLCAQRGLDASPAVKAKLLGAGDTAGAAIIDRILRDEIGHVAIGNRWFRWLCDARGLDPVEAYAELAARHAAPRPRGPFNVEARRAAGFSEAELARLG